MAEGVGPVQTAHRPFSWAGLQIVQICNNQLLGSELTLSDKPVLKFAIGGTARIQRVTLVRNVKNHQQ
jgi:hypothetical protein